MEEVYMGHMKENCEHSFMEKLSLSFKKKGYQCYFFTKNNHRDFSPSFSEKRILFTIKNDKFPTIRSQYTIVKPRGNDIAIFLYTDGIFICFSDNYKKNDVFIRNNSDYKIEDCTVYITKIIEDATIHSNVFCTMRPKVNIRNRTYVAKRFTPNVLSFGKKTKYIKVFVANDKGKRILGKKNIYTNNRVFKEIKNEGSGNRSDRELIIHKKINKSIGEKSVPIPLLYGTNRNRNKSKDINKIFGNNISDLTFGMCKVLLPSKKNHREGIIERPNFLKFEFHEKIGKHFILNELEFLEKEQFIKQLSSDLDDADDKSALIFIHGYNITFAEAAYRTAQIVYDLPFKGVGCFFSWPSAGKKLAYLKDVDNADASVNQLGDFLRIFISETKIKKLHLIAHSMGNKVLSFTLKNLSGDRSLRTKLKIINQIVLAAPDISQDVFKNELLPKLIQINARKTLYTSDKDKALDLSQFLRGEAPRLGQAGSNLFISNGIDTIDATNVPSNKNGHSYIFDTTELLSDLFLLFKDGDGPDKRRLQEEKKGSLKYWLFPQ